MNAPLRRAGVVILVLFGMLFANLNWVQAYRADQYRTSPYNSRVQVAEYERPRGLIEAGGEPLAESKATDGTLKYQRTYPEGEMYTHAVGYKPVNGLSTGIERTENEFLAGTSDKLFADRVSDMFTGKKTSGGHVVLSLNLRAQQAAWKELTNNERGVGRGAAVAIDPRTGAVQALVSMPSFDANPLASHDPKVVKAALDKLNADKDGPLKNRALSETLPPGSVFKVVVSAAALQNGYAKETEIPAGATYQPLGSGFTVHNAEDEVCPGQSITLFDALTTSCNTGYARLGVKLGADKVKAAATAFGFEQEDLTVGDLKDGGFQVAASRTGTMQNADGSIDPAALAQSSLGQKDVRMTPLQGALMAATVANDGKQMRPYLVQKLLDADRSQIYNADPEVLREPVDARVAGDLQDMMVSVVTSGTGRKAKISGFRVGGKTGTAQNAENKPPHGWFVGFAINDKGQPVSAVCVVLENVPGGHASAEAARIAGLIMRAAAGRGKD